MKIYTDVVGRDHDELLSDMFPIKENGVLYEVEARRVQRTTGVEADLGATDTAEAEPGDAEDSVDVIDLVDTFRLNETPISDRRQYLAYLKRYTKDVLAFLRAGDPQGAEAFQAGVQQAVKSLAEDFDSYRFFEGEHRDGGMIIPAKFAADGGTATFYYFRHGLQEREF
ncbi:translationally-controlled tumor protein [Streptomyces sp. NPDC102415]|uniref:translationally-controlled tumor protein n=1 Tax=unclassified Streptomyces TaxID=2593676 RepID=UPI00381B2134